MDDVGWSVVAVDVAPGEVSGKPISLEFSPSKLLAGATVDGDRCQAKCAESEITITKRRGLGESTV
jgi:hypothetical protein